MVWHGLSDLVCLVRLRLRLAPSAGLSQCSGAFECVLSVGFAVGLGV